MKFRLMPSVRIITTPNGAFVVDYATSECLVLNGSGRKICTYLENGDSVETIKQNIEREFESIHADVIRTDVERFFEKLKEHSLIRETSE